MSNKFRMIIVLVFVFFLFNNAHGEIINITDKDGFLEAMNNAEDGDIIKLVDDIDNSRGNKWFLAIGLVIGLSFGVHFMALLAIPSIGYLYYFKRYKTVTIKNFIIANIIVVSILLIVFLFLLPYTLAFFGKTEIFIVNSIGLPFNSGTIIAFLILVAAFVFGLKYTQQNNKTKTKRIPSK